LSQIAKHLRANEKVLSSGKPVKAPFIFPSLAAIPFGLIFLAAPIIWMREDIQIPWGAGWWLFGLFFFIGFGVSFGPLIGQLMRYRNTEYAITDQRIITQTGAIGLDTRSVDLDRIQEVYVTVGLVDKIFGTGTVLAVSAGYVPVVTMVGTGTGAVVVPFRPGLSSLKEPYEVHKLLQEALEKARRSQAG